MKNGDQKTLSARLFVRIVTCLFALVTCHLSLVAPSSHAVIRDRVVAFVDDQAVTWSELDEQYRNTTAISASVSRSEVLNTMINRIVLLKDARKYRIEAPSVEQVLKDYVDLKIRAFIRVNDADIARFYQENQRNFEGRDFEEVRDEIDRYLTEKELNERLKETLNDLRKKSYIRTFLDTP